MKTAKFKNHQIHVAFSGIKKSYPVTLQRIESLKKRGFLLDQHLTALLNDSIPSDALILKHFQEIGVRYIDRHNGRALVGDEMGLGKTVQALWWVRMHPEIKRLVILCTASIKTNWMMEYEKWVGSANIHILEGRKGETIPKSAQVVILNFDIIANKYKVSKTPSGRKSYKEEKNTGWVDFLVQWKPDTIIIDECHKLQNSKSFRTKGTQKLANKCKYIIGLSGTPILNRPIDGYIIFKLIAPHLFKNKWEYSQRYCDLKHDGFGWNDKGKSNELELHALISEHVMIRRLKKDVMKELPDKTRVVVPLQLPNYSKYKQLEGQLKIELKSKQHPKLNKLAMIQKLKNYVVEAKMPQIIKWIEDFLESGEKLIVFTIHKKTIKTLVSKFSKISVKIDGETPSNKRKAIETRFQTDDKIRLFFGNLDAAGEGLTLTAASNVLKVELGWISGKHAQAEDRAHRYGQLNAVTAWYLVAKDTIEYSICTLLDEKSNTTAQILDGEEAEKSSMLTSLMKQYS